MPVGPSHGSHGGGHSFGGSHHSGGYHGGSRNSNSGGSFVGGLIGGLAAGIISERRRRRFYDRYGYYPEDREFNSTPTRQKPVGFLIFSIFILFFCLITFAILSSVNNSISQNNGYIKTMESDWEEYEQLINNAKNGQINNCHLATATFNHNIKINSYTSNPTIPGIYFDFEEDNIAYYFIVYRYTDNNSIQRIGTTYTQFSASQADSKGGNIQIAYTTDSHGNHYSINTDYKLSTCAEYNHYKTIVKNNGSTKNVLIVILIVEILLIALFIFLYIKKIKKYNELIKQDDELIYQKRKAEADKATAEVKNQNRFCQYCGCKLSDSDNTCPSCGARLQK